MDTFRAQDLADEHVGQRVTGEGVDGVLVALQHLDDLLVQLALDRPPHLVTIPAGRPVEVTSP